MTSFSCLIAAFVLCTVATAAPNPPLDVTAIGVSKLPTSLRSAHQVFLAQLSATSRQRRGGRRGGDNNNRRGGNNGPPPPPAPPAAPTPTAEEPAAPATGPAPAAPAPAECGDYDTVRAAILATARTCLLYTSDAADD